MSVFDSFKKDNGIDQKDEKKGQSTYASFLRDNDVQDRRSWEAEKEWERYQATQGAVKEAQGLSWMPGVGTEDAGKQQYAKAIDWSIAYQKAEDDARAAALEGGQQAKEQAAAMQTDIDAAKGTLSKQPDEAWLEMIGKAVDGAWAGMTGTSAPITSFSDFYQGQIDDQTKQVEELEGQQRDLMFQYYSSLFAAKDFDKNSQKPQTAENGEDMDYIGGMVGGGIHQPGQMSEDEVAIYNYLYNTQGAQAAKEFVDFLGTDLDARWRLSKEQAAADYAKKDPVGASIGSVLLSPLKVGGYLMQVGDYLADGEIDQNATYNLASYQSNAIRSTVGGMIDDAAGGGFWGGAAKLGYDSTMSMGDFLLDTAISGGSKTLSLAIMGSGAATDTVIQAKDNGLSDGQAFWLGAIAGGAEIAMEKIGMDALFDAAFRKSKGTLMYILKNALSEGVEEVGTELINTIADTIIAGDKSQMQRAIDAYMAEDRNMSESKAFGLWLRDKAVEIGVSFAGGAVSGGVMGGGMAAIDATQVNALAAKIDKGLVYVDLGDVVAQGLELDPASNGYALAQMIEAQMEAGETISNKDVARLMLINETVQGGGQPTEEPVVDDDGDAAPAPVSPAPEGGTLSKGEPDPSVASRQLPWKGSLTPQSAAPTAPLEGELTPQSAAPTAPLKGEPLWTRDDKLGDLMADTVERLRQEADTPVGNDMVQSAIEELQDAGKLSRKTVVELTQDRDALAWLSEQTGIEMPDTASGKRNAVRAAVQALADGKAAVMDTQTKTAAAPETMEDWFDEFFRDDETSRRSGADSKEDAAHGTDPLPSSGEMSSPQQAVAEDQDVFNEWLDEAFEDLMKKYEASRKSGADSKEDAAVESRASEGDVWATGGGLYGSRTSDAHPYDGDADGYIREAASAMGIKKAAADVLVGAFHAEGGVDAQVYAQGIREAYEYGSVNMPFGELATKAPFASMMTERQRKVAYELGQMFGGKKTAKEQATARKSRKADPDTSGGKVHFEGDRGSLTEIQKSSLDAMEMMAKTLGVQIYVFRSEGGNENGWYDPKDGSIHIDLNAGMDGKGTMLFTLAHELTHFIRQWSPAKFRVLANFLTDRYAEQGVSVAELVKEQQDKAAHHGVELSHEEAYEEVIADSMEAMLTDGNVVRMMAELRQQDRTLWQKICDWFKDLEKKIRGVIDAYRGVEPDSKEGKMVAQMEDALVILESLYADALVDASENFAGAQKNTDPKGGVKYSVERTQYMSWDDQVKGALYGGNNIRRNDTLVIAKPADTAVSNVINDVPLAIPLRVLTKASSGKDISHSIKRGKLAKLDQGIKNAPITIVNPDRNAVVFVTNIVQGGLPVIVAFDMNAVFDGDKVHKATSIHLQGDTQAMLQNLSEKATVYVQKNELDPVGATNNLRGLAAKIKFIERVPQQDSNVKKKSSLRDTRGRELSAQQQEYFKDSMVRLDSDGEYWYGEGELAPVYHATDAEFTMFLKKHLGESTAKNSVDPFYEATAAVGFWFNTNDPVASGKMSGHSIEAYLNAERLYDAGTLHGLASEIWDLAEGTTSPKRAAKLYTDSMKARGYDGIVIQDEEMGGISFVVFESNQIKSVSNRTPTKKKDIRYSSRDLVAKRTADALEKENARLREDVGRLKELVKLQKKVTGGTMFTKSSVDTAAKYLKNQVGAKGDTGELAGMLDAFYGMIVKGEELSWENVSKAAEPIAQWLQEHQEQKNKRDDRASEILRQIRGSRVSLDEQQKQEAAYRYGSYNEFRKRAFGTILFSDSGTTSLDSLWGELAAEYPDIFDPDTNAADMPTAFMDAVTKLRSMTAADSYFEDSFQMQELIRMVYDSYWRASTLRTVADVKQKEIDLLKAKHARQMTELREGRDEKIAQLKEQHRQSQEKNVEGRKKTEVRHKIRGVVKELEKLLLREDKKHHVPDKLKKAVASALEMVDMEPVDLQSRISKYEAAIQRTTDEDLIRSYRDTIVSLQEKAQAVGKRLEELRQGYEDIINSPDPDISSGYDPVIAGNLKELAETIGDTPLRDMTMGQLEDVYAMYKMVLTRVRDANKVFLAEKSATISQIASKVIRDVEIVGGKHTYLPGTGAMRAFFWNNLKPIYAMEKIGSPALKDSFMELIRGEGVYAQDVEQAKGFSDEARKRYGYDKWDMKKSYTFQSASGIDFQLTLEQILSLYAYSRRDQALEHLRLGGFVFDNAITTHEVVDKDGKKRKKLRKHKVNTASAHQLTPDILSEITDKLTDKQRQFVEEMQGYLSDTMGAKGNEVTMAMYGVKLFKEKNYFPLKSAKQYLFEQNEAAGEVKIKNSGFTQKTRAKANNPVILQNFMDVWAGHVHDMSMYHAFLLPLEDFNRIFNYNTAKSEGVDPKSVKGTIQNAYGEEAVKYVRQMITDLNGGARSDPREQPGKALMGKFKKAAVVASLSVAIQQPSALNRAKALVGDKYFLSLNPRLVSMKRLWKELKTYAPVAVIKEMGRFDMDTSVSTVDYIKNEGGIMKRIDDATGWLPGKADEWAWVQIWTAVKKETAAKRADLDVGSAAFLRAAGERFTEVIVKTQVYDSTLSRSANMRSKNLFMSMATSFMAEPTTSINMIEDALRQFKRGYRRQAVKTVRAVLDSVVVNALLVSLIYAMRDDDEDETWWEKYAAALGSELVDGVNPLTYIPFVKDVWSLMQGYDVERSDMSLINDVVDALDRWGQLVGTDTSDMDEAALEAHQEKLVGAAWTLVDGVASAFGLPVKNIRRDIQATINTYQTATNGLEDNGSSFWDAVQDALASSVPVVDWFYEETKADRLYQAIVTGDDAYRKRIEAQYSSEDALVSAVRKVFRERYLEGAVDEAVVVDTLVQYGATEDEARADISYWRYAGDHPDEEVYSQWFDTYYDKVADSGVDVDVYIRYRQRAKGVTKKDEKMALINGLSISRKQKDALYYAEGWAESTIDDAPWH